MIGGLQKLLSNVKGFLKNTLGLYVLALAKE
jgi:hypothetical protein